MKKEIVLESTITCPECGGIKMEAMPTHRRLPVVL